MCLGTGYRHVMFEDGDIALHMQVRRLLMLLCVLFESRSCCFDGSWGKCDKTAFIGSYVVKTFQSPVQLGNMVY